MTVRILGDMSLDAWCQLIELALAGDAAAAEIVTDLNQADFDKITLIASERRRVLAHAITTDHLASPDPARRAGPDAAELRQRVDHYSDVRGQARLELALSAQHVVKVAGR